MINKFLDINNLSSFLKGITQLPDKLDFIIKNLENLIPTRPDIFQIITYRDAIQYFIVERPSDPSITKGAILLENHSQGYLITQVFLNSNNILVGNFDGTPYGRRIITEQIDQELQYAFGDKNLIIVE